MPPSRDDVIQQLKALRPELQERGIGHLYLFGSVASGEAEEGSDIDLFFDYRDDRGLSIFKQINTRHLLEDLFRCEVDLIPRTSLLPSRRAPIEQSSVQVF